MNEKMTPWFPSSVKPIRAGVYEVDTPNCRVHRYAYFDEKGWRLCSHTKQDAEREKDYPRGIAGSSMLFPESKWRGFTEEQK